jgi:chromosome segregation ATPase
MTSSFALNNDKVIKLNDELSNLSELKLACEQSLSETSKTLEKVNLNVENLKKNITKLEEEKLTLKAAAEHLTDARNRVQIVELERTVLKDNLTKCIDERNELQAEVNELFKNSTIQRKLIGKLKIEKEKLAKVGKLNYINYFL